MSELCALSGHIWHVHDALVFAQPKTLITMLYASKKVKFSSADKSQG